MGTLTQLLGAGGGIKSVQTGVITVTATTLSGGLYTGANTATITSVNTAKAFVLLNGVISSSTTQNAYVRLTNATTVTAQASSQTSGQTFDIAYTVVEFL